jgi:transcriptional regulator with XRE-family HTH domain
MLTTKERAQAVGERIVAARKRKGMSQVDLAKSLAERYGRDSESVRRTLVNNETGRYSPRLHFLEAIAEATDQPLEFFAVEDLGDGDGDPVPFREAV